MRWNNAHEFYLEVDGKSMWGGQCVHLFNGFMGEMYGVQFGCNTTGYAKDIWNERKTSGILNYFDEVPVDKMVDGDWAVYGDCAFAPVSHIAMFRKDNDNGTGVFLQQNDGRHPLYTGQDDNPYAGIMGGLRLKDWHKVNSNVKYCGHLQDIGWTNWVSNGEIAGTTGQSRRMEAIKIDAPFEIKAKAHLQDIGDVDYGTINKDTIIGTTGESRRLEALALTGNFTYRVHIQNIGWTEWKKADGSWIGTKGQSLRLEAIEIKEA